MAQYNKQSDRMAWGITLLAFGVLLLLDRLGVTDMLPFGRFLQSPGTYFLTAGIIFLIKKKEKTLGLVLSAIGVLIHSDLFFGWIKVSQNFLLPIVLFVIGGALVLINKKK